MSNVDPKDGSQGLDNLLGGSSAARQYFNSLPEYVQQMIVQRRQSIKNEDDLHSYASNLTQGDK